jgi:hypothetical protein
MKELPDDELDKLFKKSAEELDSTFDPQDWNTLRKGLDMVDGKTPVMWWKKWWPAGLLALLMIGGLGSYWFINDKKSEKHFVARNAGKTRVGTAPAIKNGVVDNQHRTEKGDSQDVAIQSKSISEIEKVDPFGGNKAIDIDKRAGESLSEKPLLDGADHKGNTKTNSKKILPRRWSKTGGVYLGPNRSIGRGGDGAFNTNENVVKSSGVKVGEKGAFEESNKTEREAFNSPKNRVIKSEATDEIAESVLHADVPVVSDTVTAEKRLLISADLLPSRAMIWNKTNALPKVKPVLTRVSEPVKAAAEEEEPTPKLAVRFSYSPDLSAVGLKNFSKPGNAVSLLIEYALFRRLYIQTGVARSSKVYNAKAGDYEWPASWYDQKTLPTSVDGVCKIIEIPLNFRYDLTQTERTRWFASAGASSYYMQNEKYDYNYPEHTYGIKWQNYETSTGWYWLSHLNASIGFEYRLSKKLSLIAEPYVRMPVKKVGFGKVDLFTFGTWFSIRYTPVFK